ncbi:hypothetical protein IQ07DRAFT_674481 [Pyrenochaeta sp. DS3sAY3a]|nr:hypothetical protein IQ07DRAFT_674481 [Pyrenochaeta sp. DS3sAY3a]
MPFLKGHMPVIYGFDVLPVRKRDSEGGNYNRMRRCIGGFAIALLEVKVLELDVDVRYDAETFHQVFTWAHHPDLHNVKFAPFFTYRESGTFPEETIRVANKAGYIMFGGVEYGPSEYELEHDEEYVDPPQCSGKNVKTMVADINAITSSVHPPPTPPKKGSNEDKVEASLWVKKQIIERLATQGLSSDNKTTQEDYWVEAFNAAFPELKPDVRHARIAAMKFKEGAMISNSSWNDKWHSFAHLSKKMNVQLKAPMLLGLSKGYEHFMNIATTLDPSPDSKTEAESFSNGPIAPVALESKLQGADVSPPPAKPKPMQSKVDAEPKFIPSSTAFSFEKIIKKGKKNVSQPISKNIFQTSKKNGPEEMNELVPEKSGNSVPPAKKKSTFKFDLPEDWAEGIRKLFPEAPEDMEVKPVNEQDHSEHANGLPPPSLTNNSFAATGFGFMCNGEKQSDAFDFACPVKSSSESAEPVTQETLSFNLGNPVTTPGESSATPKMAAKPALSFKPSEEFFGAVLPSLSPKEPVPTPTEPLLIPAEPSVTSAEPSTNNAIAPATPEKPIKAPEEPTTTIGEPGNTADEPTTTVNKPTATAKEPNTTLEEPTITLPLRPAPKKEFASFDELMAYTKANPPVSQASSEYSTDDDYEDDAGSDEDSIGSDEDGEYDEEPITSDELIALELDKAAYHQHEEDTSESYQKDGDDADPLRDDPPIISNKAPEVINIGLDLVATAHHKDDSSELYEEDDDDADSLYADPPKISKKTPMAEVLSSEAKEEGVNEEDVASLRELLPFGLIWPKENETLKPLCDLQLPPMDFDDTPLGEMLGLAPQLPPLEFEETSFGDIFGKETFSASPQVSEPEEQSSERISKSSTTAAKTVFEDVSLTSVSIDILGWVQEEIQALSQLATTVCEQVSVLKIAQTAQNLDPSAAPTKEIKIQLDKNIGRLVQRGFSSINMANFSGEGQMPPARESTAATNASSQSRGENPGPSSAGHAHPLLI